MNDFLKTIDAMPEEVYQNLKRAVETGKWPGGAPVSAEQRAIALRAVLAWNRRHGASNEQIGEIDTPDHAHCGAGTSEEEEWQTLRWIDEPQNKKGS